MLSCNVRYFVHKLFVLLRYRTRNWNMEKQLIDFSDSQQLHKDKKTIERIVFRNCETYFNHNVVVDDEIKLKNNTFRVFV